MSGRSGWTLVTVVLVAAVLVGGGVGLSASTQAQSGPTEIDGCYTITEPGTYHLTKDIRGGGGGGNFTYISETCIVIASDDVVFDGQGHTIDGLGISDTTAVGTEEGSEYENVTVRNFHTTDWNRGVYFGNTTDATVESVNASGLSYGVFIEDASDTTVRDVTATGDFIGVYHADSEGNTFENNEYDENYIGDVVDGASEPAPEEETETDTPSDTETDDESEADE
jgi:parallel beta-helix repeat protein